MPSVRFLYTYCNDLEAMRRFYVDLLGLAHTSVENGKQGGFVEIDCGGFRLTFMQSSTVRPVQTEHSKLPGVVGGTAEQVLCSVEYDAEGYAGVVERLRAAGVPAAKADAERGTPHKRVQIGLPALARTGCLAPLRPPRSRGNSSDLTSSQPLSSDPS